MSVGPATVFCLLAALQGGEATDPTITVELIPDTVYIGDRLTLEVAVTGLEAVDELAFPSFPDTGAVTALSGPRVRTLPEGGGQSAEYTLSAWRPGDQELPAVAVRVQERGAERLLPLPSTRLHVRSTLPPQADSDTLSWKPARGVLGSNWSLLEKLLAGFLILALGAAVLYWIRRRQRLPVAPRRPAEPSPRERAIARLGALEDSDLLEAGELKAFYSELSGVLRGFLAESDVLWGLELTTSELLMAVARDGVNEGDLASLAELLVEADLVKFARRRPSRERARTVLAEGRRWVEEFARVEVTPAAPTPNGEARPAEVEAERPAENGAGSEDEGAA